MSVIVDTSVWSLALRRRMPPDSLSAVTLLQIVSPTFPELALTLDQILQHASIKVD